VFSSPVIANCNFGLNLSKTKISWTAFKTPKKVGVKAGFDTFTITTDKGANSSSIESLVQGASFEVNALSVNSKNPERDTKLKNLFFSKSATPLSISGKVVGMTKNELEVELELNGVKKKLMMNTTIKDNLFTANGKIDVLDFSLNENLSKLNEACKVLHEGKTWSDVEITIESEFDKNC
jgi:hypothetical protein